MSPEEEVVFARQLGRVVEYIDQLRTYEIEVEETLASPGVPQTADTPRPGLERAVFLANAPEAMDGFLVVPQVKSGDAS